MDRVRFTLVSIFAAATVLVPVTAWAGTAESRAASVEEIRQLANCRSVSRAFTNAMREYEEYRAMRPYRGAEERYALERVSAAGLRATQLSCPVLNVGRAAR